MDAIYIPELLELTIYIVIIKSYIYIYMACERRTRGGAICLGTIYNIREVKDFLENEVGELMPSDLELLII